MGSGFRDVDRFSKLLYLGIKLGHWKKFQKLQILVYYLSVPWGKIELIFAPWAVVSKTFKIAIFRHEIRPLEKAQQIAHILSFYHMGSKLSIFCSTGRGFRDTD